MYIKFLSEDLGVICNAYGPSRKACSFAEGGNLAEIRKLTPYIILILAKKSIWCYLDLCQVSNWKVVPFSVIGSDWLTRSKRCSYAGKNLVQ